jgi:hypothetical protein
MAKFFIFNNARLVININTIVSIIAWPSDKYRVNFVDEKYIDLAHEEYEKLIRFIKENDK